jgi:hypothetical protein
MKRILSVALLLPLIGCASLRYADQPRPETVLESGLEAHQEQEFVSAYSQLSWIYENFWDRAVGERALLAMAAVELDPRNPGRRLGTGAEIASWYPELPTAQPWTAPVARTLQALAVELDEARSRIEDLETEKRTLEDQLAHVERQRQAARAEADRAAAAARRAREEAAAARVETGRARAEAQAAGRAAASARAPAAGSSALRAERDRLARELSAVRAQLEERERDLERVRKTLEP